IDRQTRLRQIETREGLPGRAGKWPIAAVPGAIARELIGGEGHVVEGERRHAEGLTAIGRLDERSAIGVLRAIAEGATTVCLPGDVDGAAGPDRNVRSLVAA